MFGPICGPSKPFHLALYSGPIRFYVCLLCLSAVFSSYCARDAGIQPFIVTPLLVVATTTQVNNAMEE